jgi:hypothetical protein
VGGRRIGAASGLRGAGQGVAHPSVAGEGRRAGGACAGQGRQHAASLTRGSPPNCSASGRGASWRMAASVSRCITAPLMCGREPSTAASVCGTCGRSHGARTQDLAAGRRAKPTRAPRRPCAREARATRAASLLRGLLCRLEWASRARRRYLASGPSRGVCAAQRCVWCAAQALPALPGTCRRTSPHLRPYLQRAQLAVEVPHQLLQQQAQPRDAVRARSHQRRELWAEEPRTAARQQHAARAAAPDPRVSAAGPRHPCGGPRQSCLASAQTTGRTQGPARTSAHSSSGASPPSPRGPSASLPPAASSSSSLPATARIAHAAPSVNAYHSATLAGLC